MLTIYLSNYAVYLDNSEEYNDKDLDNILTEFEAYLSQLVDDINDKLGTKIRWDYPD